LRGIASPVPPLPRWLSAASLCTDERTGRTGRRAAASSRVCDRPGIRVPASTGRPKRTDRLAAGFEAERGRRSPARRRLAGRLAPRFALVGLSDHRSGWIASSRTRDQLGWASAGVRVEQPPRPRRGGRGSPGSLSARHSLVRDRRPQSDPRPAPSPASRARRAARSGAASSGRGRGRDVAAHGEHRPGLGASQLRLPAPLQLQPRSAARSRWPRPGTAADPATSSGAAIENVYSGLDEEEVVQQERRDGSGHGLASCHSPCRWPRTGSK